MGEVLVRRARAADAADIERLALASAEHFLPAVFGPRIARAVRTLASGRGTLFSHAHAWMAEIDGRAVGMLLGYSGAEKAAEDPATGMGLLRTIGPGMVRRLGRLLRLQRMIGTIEAKEWYVSNVAVYAEFRGHGIGRTLMEVAEQEARDAGSVSVVLNVETDNVSAIRLYEMLGFAILGRTRSLRMESREFAFLRMGKRVAPEGLTPA